MPNIGVPELLVILLVALVVFGPRKLPELGKSLGAGLREFRKSTQGLKEEFEGNLHDTPPGPAPVQTVHTPAQTMVVAAIPGAVEVVPAQGAPLPAAPLADAPLSTAPLPAAALAVPTPAKDPA